MVLRFPVLTLAKPGLWMDSALGMNGPETAGVSAGRARVAA